MSGIKECALRDSEYVLEQLARALDISWSDLESLGYEIIPDESDDGLIYQYIVQFSPDNDLGLLRNIKGLDGGLKVVLEPAQLDYSAAEAYEFSAIKDNASPAASFEAEISGLKELMGYLSVGESGMHAILARQIFIGVIGALETYLSDTFVNRVLSSREYLRRFVVSFPEFQKSKFALSEIFLQMSSIEDRARDAMMGVIYHNLPIVKNMYSDSLGIEFPDVGNIMKYVNIRHDLVHRSGGTKSGEQVFISRSDLEKLIFAVSNFVAAIEDRLSLADLDDLPF